MWDPYAEFQSTTLSNGLEVHAAHWPGRPWEAMGFLIHSGAGCDPIGSEGLAHFVEHLVSENANISKKDMDMFFRGCGGRAHFGSTGYPSTYYQFFVPIDKAILAKAFSIFGHMLLSAQLEKNIERERQVIVGEFHRRYQIEFQLDLDRREHKALYAGHFLERFVSPFGNLESIERIMQGDLQSYYDQHYTPANMSIVGVGGLQLAELVEFLSESPFAVNKEGKRALLPLPAADVSLPLETRHVFEASKHFVVPINAGAYRSVAKIPGSISCSVVHILVNMLDEVLDEEVRQRRAWAYNIDSSWDDSPQNFYAFLIKCHGLALKAMDEIEEVIESCITSVGNREDLFERTKQSALVSNFMIDPTGRGICEGTFPGLSRYERIISLAEVGHELERVTMDDIRNVLRWLRQERRWTLITRP